ncbi:hypothetical protein K438DRAFT_1857053 [Mycena galopus ATCC 62051]|nr:hypothetical protein K438DRAFT_1857053 [Mycena galopus ATCC 62051]
MGNTHSLPPASRPRSKLQRRLNKVFASSPGSVFYPQDAEYQSKYVKAYNQHIPITPAAVTRPTTTQEVSQIVKCAADTKVKVQARSGGHSYGNYGLGGVDNAVVVDLVNFQQFSMDETTWHATVGAGTLLADLTKRLSDAGGRAIAHGTCPQVGVGGHATIGGLGPVSRQWGMALDHIVEVEIVLADGTITRANATQNPDILFAVKGAGASFGIITEFVFRTHPTPPNIMQYSYKVEFGKHADMVSTFETWQTLVADPALDRKLASQVIITDLTMVISGTYFGTKEEYAKLPFHQQLAQKVPPLIEILDDWIGAVGTWAQDVFGGDSAAFYSKNLPFRPDNLIPKEGIQNLFKYLDTVNKGTHIWFAIFDLAGGAVSDVPQDATGFAHRDTLFYFQTYAVGIGELSQTTIDFVTGMNKKITDSMPGVSFGAYPGYVDPLLKDGPLEYWGSNLPRLQKIKAAIDPGDLFHNPQSVPVA